MTVWGIEISEESVACAIENAELNSIGNAAFFAGNVGEVLRDLRERAGEPDVVVVDPPRAGLAGKALKRLGELAAPRVVYVSCNPTTLAGDAKRLAEDYGYRLVRTTPVDMFPHTPHVESVSLLERAVDRDARRRPPAAAAARAGRRSASRKPSEMPRQRRQSGHVPPDRDADHRQRQASDHADPRPERRAARSGRAAARNSGEERRRPAARARPSRRRGRRTTTADAAEDLRVVLGDVVRRPAPDGVRVHQRDQRRDEHDPRQLLEELQEQEPEERVRAELAEARRRSGGRRCQKHDREHEQADDRREQHCHGARASGSASQTSRNVAGIRTSAISRMLGQSRPPSTWSSTTLVPRRRAPRRALSTAAARPTRARPA